jgi:L-lactate dehydrogenase (cytochrome)/(S)-mandelate dehydrogenase
MPAFEYRLRAPENLITIEDYRRAASRRVPKMVWAYVDKGAEDLGTLRANRAAFGRWSLRMRALTGHASRDLSTTVAGVRLELPVLLAPTGMLGISHWTGDRAAARAAESAGSRMILSTGSSWSIEEVAEVTTQDHFFQLYPFTGDIAPRMMQRALDAEYKALFVTVDVQTVGNREYERKTGMGLPPVVTPRRMLNVARHPRWAYHLFRHKRSSMRNLVTEGSVRAAVHSARIHHR